MYNAIKELSRLHVEFNKKKYPSFPENYFAPTKYSDATANGLTKCIKAYINFIGGFARRVNTTGQYVQPKAKDGIIQRGYYRKTTATKGEADINFIYKGKAFAIEVKIGNDRQSDYQKEFQKNFEKAEGFYFIAKDFQSFFDWFQQFIK